LRAKPASGFNPDEADIQPSGQVMSKKQDGYEIVINWDPASMWLPILKEKGAEDGDARTIVSLIEGIIDEHAKADVDIMVHCLWLGFQTKVPNSKTAQTVREGIEPFKALKKLDAAGLDLVDVMIARCRKHGMRFYAGMRMNDRHLGSGESRRYRPWVQKMVDEHPECELKEFPGGVDYKYDYVRDAIVPFIEELTEKYDIDGLEFDWPRWCHVFKTSEAVANAPLLTDFVRQARQILDAASQRRGRGRLPLGARIAQTMDENLHLGYDVKTWVQEGLVDYLCPSDFFFTDINSRTEDFVALTDGTNCKVYPSIHPGISWQNSQSLMGLAEYRAAAKNFYAYGAHGVSPYNYQYHWAAMVSPSYPGPVEMWPKAMSFLTELRSDDGVAGGDRHYLYHPLWSGDTEGHAPTWAYKNDKIALDCSADDPRGTFTFRMAEDLSDASLTATLEFKVTYMVEGEQIEVRINADVIPPQSIETEWRVGQSREEGRPLGQHFLFRMKLSTPPVKFGDNELSLRLVKRIGMARRVLHAQEFEVHVSGA
jgi:hypothetical protein